MMMGFDGMIHLKGLAAHGAKVRDDVTGDLFDLDEGFYWSAVGMCDHYGAVSIDFDLVIPETDEMMILRIWKDGHVDSGSYDSVMACNR